MEEDDKKKQNHMIHTKLIIFFISASKAKPYDSYKAYHFFHFSKYKLEAITVTG